MLFGEWDMDKAIEVSREEGFKDGVEFGVERGIVRGREEERRDLVFRMLERNDPKTIADILGLSINEILKYQKKQKNEFPINKK